MLSPLSAILFVQDDESCGIDRRRKKKKKYSGWQRTPKTIVVPLPGLVPSVLRLKEPCFHPRRSKHDAAPPGASGSPRSQSCLQCLITLRGRLRPQPCCGAAFVGSLPSLGYCSPGCNMLYLPYLPLFCTLRITAGLHPTSHTVRIYVERNYYRTTQPTYYVHTDSV